MNHFLILLLLIVCPVNKDVRYEYDKESMAPRLQTWHLRSAAPINLNGYWEGELLQNKGGVADKFQMQMEIHQTGIHIVGTTYVRYQEIWVEMAFSGYQELNGSWKVVETKILRSQKPDYMSWCMKSYELRLSYAYGGEMLIGPWWGMSEFGPCVPGSIRLKKRPIIA